MLEIYFIYAHILFFNIFYISVTIDKKLVSVSNLFIQLNYKGITTVYKWQIGKPNLKQLQLKSNRRCGRMLI